jgi:hypothetical protein
VRSLKVGKNLLPIPGAAKKAVGDAAVAGGAAAGGGILDLLKKTGVADAAKPIVQHMQDNPEQFEALGDVLNILTAAPAAKPAVKAGRAVIGSADDLARAVTAGIAGKGAKTKSATSLQSTVLNKVREMIDNQSGIIRLPDGKAKALREMTEGDVVKLIRQIGGDSDIKPAIEALRSEMVQLRRSVGELSLSEQKRLAKGKLVEPLREGMMPIDPGAPKLRSWPSAVGRGIDERHFYALSQPRKETTPDFEQLLVRARQHLLDRAVDGADEEVSKVLVKSLSEVENVGKGLTKQKRAILDANKGKTIDLAEILEGWQGAVNDRLGADIQWRKNSRGALVADVVDAARSGRTIVDPEAVGPIKEIAEAIRRAPAIADVQYADDLKRKIQKLAYNKKTGRTPDAARSLSRQLAHNIDEQLDAVLGDQYRIANDKMRQLINLEEHMSSRLGKTVNLETGLTMHGASMMKRAMQSAQDSGIKDLFRQIYEITNGKYDLFQAAAYAEAAMKAVGDVKAFSLLETTSKIPTGPKGLADMLLKLGPKAAGRAATVRPTSPLGKGDADFLLDYYKKAQRKAAKQKPPTRGSL